MFSNYFLSNSPKWIPISITKNDPWELSLDIDDSDLCLTPVLRSSSSTHVEPSPSTQNTVRIIPGPAGIKVVEDVGEDEDFKSGAWVSATDYVNANGGTSCSPNVIGDLTVAMKDLSGTIPGIIYHKVISEGGYRKDITMGAALILANVLVFSPKSSMHYLNITMRNMVKVFRKDTVPESGSG
ncbi:zf-CCHC domain-containing protein [Tanacetum coccineum]